VQPTIKHIPIAMCAFCGDSATYKAPDGTHVCENCVEMYKPIFPKRSSQKASGGGQ
jgi:hypothetical protein